jgi:haloacetate dehalogenase
MQPPLTDMEALFPGFAEQRLRLPDGTLLRVLQGGQGPAVVLLHGWPQTLAAWHRIAPVLAASGYRVVVPDLPGYGQSEPAAGADVAQEPPRRTIAACIDALMDSLGHARYAVVGHDRGARAGYRLALDVPQRVAGYASLTVVPTLDIWDGIDGQRGLRGPHWFFFTQPPDLLERLLGSDPGAYLDHMLGQLAGGQGLLDARAVADYHAAIARSGRRSAMFADYGAGLGIDVEHERADRAAGRRIACPVLYCWPAGADGGDPLAAWRAWADDVSGASVGGGHLMPERAPDEVLRVLLPFLQRCRFG